MQKDFQVIYNEFIRYLPDDRLWSAKGGQNTTILAGFLKGYCLSLQWLFNELNKQLEILNPLSTSTEARVFWSQKLLRDGLFRNTEDVFYELQRKAQTVKGYGDITNEVAKEVGVVVNSTLLDIRTPNLYDIINLNLQNYTSYEIAHTVIFEIEAYNESGFPYTFPFPFKDGGIADLRYTFEKILPPYFNIIIIAKQETQLELAWGEDAISWGEDDIPWGYTPEPTVNGDSAVINGDPTKIHGV